MVDYVSRSKHVGRGSGMLSLCLQQWYSWSEGPPSHDMRDLCDFHKSTNKVLTLWLIFSQSIFRLKAVLCLHFLCLVCFLRYYAVSDWLRRTPHSMHELAWLPRFPTNAFEPVNTGSVYRPTAHYAVFDAG